jgi:cytochrome P450
VDTQEIDLTDPDAFVDDVPFDWFDRLRREDPVHWHGERAPNHGFWAITRYDDLAQVHRDWRTFSAQKGAIMLEELDEEQLESRRSLIETDPPRHSQLRALSASFFAKKAIAPYESMIRGLAKEIVDRCLERGRFDAVTEMARELPMRALCVMAGLPVEDGPAFATWADAMVGNTDPEYTDVVADRDDTEAYRLMPFRSPAGLKVFEYAAEVRRDRIAHPREDLMTALATGTVQGRPLTDVEFAHYVSLMIVAGNDTTRHTIGHGLHALIDDPTQVALLLEEPSLYARAAEEMVRWATPAMYFRRTATRDTELRGRAIREGDKVVTWYIAANRDPEVFEDPYRFDVTRWPNPQVAFGPQGASLHFCLGADLARMEVRVLFEELLPQVASMELTGTPERMRSNFHNGYKHLPVACIPR